MIAYLPPNIQLFYQAIGFAIENCIIEAEKLTRSLKIDLDV